MDILIYEHAADIVAKLLYGVLVTIIVLAMMKLGFGFELTKPGGLIARWGLQELDMRTDDVLSRIADLSAPTKRTSF